MTTQAEQLLHRGHSVTRSLLPTILAIFQSVETNQPAADDRAGPRQREDSLQLEETSRNKPDEPGIYRSGRAISRGYANSCKTCCLTLADQWLATPNDNPLFNGMAPLDRLLMGQAVDLATVRNFLDAERVGW